MRVNSSAFQRTIFPRWRVCQARVLPCKATQPHSPPGCDKRLQRHSGQRACPAQRVKAGANELALQGCRRSNALQLSLCPLMGTLGLPTQPCRQVKLRRPYGRPADLPARLAHRHRTRAVRRSCGAQPTLHSPDWSPPQSWYPGHASTAGCSSPTSAGSTGTCQSRPGDAA